FVKKNVFGQRFLTLSNAPESTVLVPTHGSISAAAAPAPATVPSAPPPPPSAAPPLRVVPSPPAPARAATGTFMRVPGMILEARAAAELVMETSAVETLGDSEIAAARDVLQAILLVPNATAASFSAFGHLGGLQEVAARGTVTDEGMSILQSKLNVWLSKRGEAGGHLRTNINY